MMEKHLFRVVSRGSSNIINVYGCSEKKMKEKASLVLAALMVASLMIGLVCAQPTVEVSPSVVKPGDTVTISGQGTPGAHVVIEISNTRGVLGSFNVTVGSSGSYSLEYSVAPDSLPDVYSVTLREGDEVVEASFIVSRMSPQQLSNTIKVMVENARRQAESALIQARKHGNPIPQEIMEKYQQGIDEIRKAGNAIQSNHYLEAQQSLREALNMFREVVDYSYGEDVAPPIDPEQERLKIQEMLQQLTRQYDEINAAVQKLKQLGLNVDILERDLGNLRNRIGEAKTLLDENKLAEAVQSIEQTRLMLQSRLVALRQRQAEITKKLALRYQASLENRVQAYIDTFTILQSVKPVQSALALQELASLQLKLESASQQLDSGNTVTALKELHYTEYRLKRLSDTVNGAVTSRLLNKIDELTASLQESTGTTTTQIEKEIEDAQTTLNDYLKSKRPIDRTNTTMTPSG